ncbi:prepilin-type N-terminal cleavage/methylation domain-containing protein [Bacillus salacetis]|uniref:Prepilin-type N-terminal cleavage/methylation domain-containing protein n=1 Tax=Bacillus salacetis TaxID=2315464 RepID=A0A3A1R4Q8_9BACI|nr:prepilin-type N-terminal cleavage/methylation domain-containing protein [Bacillus salacetis]RIW37708.1 prepilin-type N-terminal cleavage/methylation domain-containing protein [Bacillus salacetis]
MIRSTVHQLKERSKARTYDEDGFTLIELLLTLAISAILLPVIYGTFLTGYKIYEKVSIEAQLRDDADYVSAMVMNRLYSTPFDYVDECDGEDNCLKFVDSVETAQNEFNPEVIDQDKQKSSESHFEIKLSEKDGRQVWSSGGSIVDTPSDFRDSEISFKCSEENRKGQCTSATIFLDFRVSHTNHTKQLNLESSFGF